MADKAQDNTWWIVGGVAALALLGGGVAVAVNTKPTSPSTPVTPTTPTTPTKPTTPTIPAKPTTPTPVTITPPKKPGQDFPPIPGLPAGCGYKFSQFYTNKPKAELIARVKAIILKDQPGYNTQKFSNGKTIAQYMAEQLVGACEKYNLAVDVVVALARRESSFSLHLDTLSADIPNDRAIGIMQIKPSTFKFISGSSANDLLSLPMYLRLHRTIDVSCFYLRRCTSIGAPAYGMVGDTLCDVLFRYTLGPTGAKDPAKRKMRQTYVDDIIRWANDYTELRN